jgi:hypothetical protein
VKFSEIYDAREPSWKMQIHQPHMGLSNKYKKILGNNQTYLQAAASCTYQISSSGSSQRLEPLEPIPAMERLKSMSDGTLYIYIYIYISFERWNA